MYLFASMPFVFFAKFLKISSIVISHSKFGSGPTFQNFYLETVDVAGARRDSVDRGENCCRSVVVVSLCGVGAVVTS